MIEWWARLGAGLMMLLAITGVVMALYFISLLAVTHLTRFLERKLRRRSEKKDRNYYVY